MTLADLGKAEAVDTVSLPAPFGSMGGGSIQFSVSPCTWLANLRSEHGANSSAPTPVALEGTSESYYTQPASETRSQGNIFFFLAPPTIICYENAPAYE